MSRRSRPVMFASMACLLMASGCLSKNGSQGLIGTTQTINGGLAGATVQNSNLHGMVLLPSAAMSADGKSLASSYRTADISTYAPCVGAVVGLDDERLKQVPDTPSVTTDGTGSFRMLSVPPNEVWFMTAHFGGITLASAAVPLPKALGEVDVTIDLASTLAVAGILPLFTEVDTGPNAHAAYYRDDLDITLFGNLVSAVEHAITDQTSIQLNNDVTQLNPAFNQIMGNSVAVQNAYAAILKKLKDNLALRQKGLGSTIPKPGATASPVSAATATPTVIQPTNQPTTPGSTANPTAQPTATATTQALTPIMGTFTTLTTKLTYQTAARELAVTPNGGGFPTYVLVPDGAQFIAIDGTGKATTYPVNGLTHIADVCLVNETLYTVGQGTNGPSLAVVDLTKLIGATSLSPTIIPLTGQAITTIGSIAQGAADGSTLLMTDPNANAVDLINTTTGAVSTYMGAGTGKSTASAAVSSFQVTSPQGIARLGAAVYIADTNNNRIVQIANFTGKSTDTCAPYAGGGVGVVMTGSLTQATFLSPYGLTSDGVKLLYVADQGNNAVRVIDTQASTVNAYANQANPNGTNTVRYASGAGAVSPALLFATDYAGDLIEITSP